MLKKSQLRFMKLYFSSFLLNISVNLKNNRKHKLSFFSLHALLNTPLHAQGIEEGLE